MIYPTFAQQTKFKSRENDLTKTNGPKDLSNDVRTPLTLSRHLGNWAVNRLMESHSNGKSQQQNDLNLQEDNTEETINRMVSLLRKQYGISHQDDAVEREAETVSNQIVNMETPDKSQSQGMTDNGTNIWKTPKISLKQNAVTNGQNTVDLDLPTSDGLPLERSVTDYMAPRFGYNFDDVRVHRSSQSADISCSLHARAFAAGKDIYFGHSEYNPQTREGKELIAHELTHVVQQGQASQINSKSIFRAKEPRKSLTLNITKLEGSTRSMDVSDASTILENAANVEIKKGKEETLDITKSKALIGPDLILDEYPSVGSPTAEEQKLTAQNRISGTITAYFVKKLSAGSHGEAFWPSGFPTINPSVVMKNGDSPFSSGKPLAHELGHVLLDDGGHETTDITNLMSYSNTGVALDSTRKTKVRSSSFVK